jgi:predicted nucleic acid-binding Zn ribbon protein
MNRLLNKPGLVFPGNSFLLPESASGEKEGEQEEVMKSFAKWLPGCASL